MKDTRQEFDTLGKCIFENKFMFDHIKSIDPKICNDLKKKFEEKKILEHTKEIQKEFDRGGYSL